MTYVWILTVTYLFSSFTGTVTTPSAYSTKLECDQAAAKINGAHGRVIAECRAVPMVNEGNTP